MKSIHDKPMQILRSLHEIWRADKLYRTQERICESTVSSSGRAIGSLAGAALGQVRCFPLLSLPKTAAQCHRQTQTQNDTGTHTHTKRSEESDSQTLSCGKRIQDAFCSLALLLVCHKQGFPKSLRHRY